MYMNKYNAKKWNGYDRKREARRADELRLMEKAGLISDLKEQVVFELIPAYWEEIPRTGRKGQPIMPYRRCLERAVTYVADFTYRDQLGNLVVEDTKGFRTADYIIKRKLMLYIHNIRIQEK